MDQPQDHEKKILLSNVDNARKFCFNEKFGLLLKILTLFSN